MPQESLTWKFFRNGAGSEKIESVDDLSNILQAWMSDRRRYEAYREQFLSLRYEEDPTLLIDEIVSLASDTAGIPVTRHPFPPVNGNGQSAKP